MEGGWDIWMADGMDPYSDKARDHETDLTMETPRDSQMDQWRVP